MICYFMHCYDLVYIDICCFVSCEYESFLTSWGMCELTKHRIGFDGSLNAVIKLSVILVVFVSSAFPIWSFQIGFPSSCGEMSVIAVAYHDIMTNDNSKNISGVFQYEKKLKTVLIFRGRCKHMKLLGIVKDILLV